MPILAYWVDHETALRLGLAKEDVLVVQVCTREVRCRSFLLPCPGNLCHILSEQRAGKASMCHTYGGSALLGGVQFVHSLVTKMSESLKPRKLRLLMSRPALGAPSRPAGSWCRALLWREPLALARCC